MDMDETPFCRRYTVFESIFDQGDKDQRCDKRLTVRLDVDLRCHLYIGGQTDAHQFDIVADKVSLLAQRDISLHNGAAYLVPAQPVVLCPYRKQLMHRYCSMC